jgi:hypothetical protein
MRKSTDKTMPALKAPKFEIEDRGTVRLGNGNVTAEFPPLKQPGLDIADRGTIRLGNGNITAEFPA